MSESTSLARLQELLPQLFQPVQILGEPYLRFQLTPEIPALLSMEKVQEAILVPASLVTPLPNMPEFVLGVMSARDRVFCVVDLGQLLGLPPMPLNLRDYQVVIVQLPSSRENTGSASPPSEQYLGLAVSRIRGIARIEVSLVQLQIGEVPECLKPYLMGCVIEADGQALILDDVAIEDSHNLSQNSWI